MEIILVRHGKPTAAKNPKVNAAGYANWVRNYNKSVVFNSSRPCPSLPPKLEGFYVVSSDLTRAIQSAGICGVTPQKTYSDFREMYIPYYRLPFKLKAWTWLYLSRVLWTFGKKGKFESYKQAKMRAQIGCEILESLAHKHGKVALFAHGYMNFHVRRELVKQGWQVTEKSNQYFQHSHLILK